jgi:uncharacterized protein YjbJ (UPF0337 family)
VSAFQNGDVAPRGAFRAAQLQETAQGLHPLWFISNPEVLMGREDVAAGKMKQLKGKANDVAGAVKGNSAQQLKGKVQKAAGKVQERLARKSNVD